MSIGNEEFMAPSEVAKLQHRRWQSQRRYVRDHSDFFKHLWNGCKIPERLEELPLLPLCNKGMLRESQAAKPPFGNHLATSDEQIIRLHRTSGTTGHAMYVGLTQFDAEQTARIGARCHRAGWSHTKRPGDTLPQLPIVDGWTDRPSLC